MTWTDKTAIVVPCYNEAERLALDEYRKFSLVHPHVEFLFVDDGSRDRTLETLRALQERDPCHFHVLSLPSNRGKAEAVRRGMLYVLSNGARYAGYWDADLATPLAEIPRFIEVLSCGHDACFGSRVRLLGRSIARSPARHYLGRIFATAASHILNLPVYDTQCGAKLFRASPHTRALFEEPFCVNWTFDVELIARMQTVFALDAQGLEASQRIYELPLDEWRDVAGSNVKPTDFVKGIHELTRILYKYRLAKLHKPAKQVARQPASRSLRR